jgi:hypothetical protein
MHIVPSLYLNPSTFYSKLLNTFSEYSFGSKYMFKFDFAILDSFYTFNVAQSLYANYYIRF